ncbi:MAG: hypothetical protein D6795_10520 [Deltaproteobacteria bacterium]|nr:MAG: hypothetical protein D6795_10520 [Deltaproteobacteria bacterium]
MKERPDREAGALTERGLLPPSALATKGEWGVWLSPVTAMAHKKRLAEELTHDFPDEDPQRLIAALGSKERFLVRGIGREGAEAIVARLAEIPVRARAVKFPPLSLGRALLAPLPVGFLLLGGLLLLLGRAPLAPLSWALALGAALWHKRSATRPLLDLSRARSPLREWPELAAIEELLPSLPETAREPLRLAAHETVRAVTLARQNPAWAFNAEEIAKNAHEALGQLTRLGRQIAQSGSTPSPETLARIEELHDVSKTTIGQITERDTPDEAVREAISRFARQVQTTREIVAATEKEHP